MKEVSVIKDLYLEEKKILPALLSLIFSILTTYFILLYVSNHFNFADDVSKTGEIFVLKRNLLPERQERILFFSGCVIMPIILFLLYNIFARLLRKMTNNVLVQRSYNILYFITIISIFYMIWIGLKSDKYYFMRNSVGFSPMSIFILCIATFFIYFIMLYYKKNYKLTLLTDFVELTLNCLSITLIFSIFLFCILDTGLISLDGVYDYHFNSVFDPIVQVHFGKGVLIDFFSLYGFYPHFLDFIFKMLGLNVLNFTALMGLLMGLSIFLIYKFTREITFNKIVGYIGFISMIYYSYYFGRVMIHDPYFQYYPVRFLFPAISIYLTYKNFETNSSKLYYISFFIYSIAILWNFDTGFVVFISWLLVLLFHELFRLKLKEMLLHIIRALIIFMITISLFTLYMYIRYGSIPDYSKFLIYQNIYYKYGFMMLPMKVIHPWNIVVFIYVLGLLYSYICLFYKNESIKSKMIFYLSILGMGIFFYYQGRSHNLNLNNVCFPAIILTTIFADSLLNRIKIKSNYNDILAFMILIYFMLFSSSSLMKNSYRIYDTIKNRLRFVINKEVSFITENANFIKDNTAEGEEVLILSNLSAIYHLESKTKCPLKIPSPTDLYLVEEYKKIYEYLEDDTRKKVIHDKYSGREEIVSKYLSKYEIKGISPYGNIVIYVKD